MTSLMGRIGSSPDFRQIW